MYKCLICGNSNVHKHHVFFGNPGRKLSEKFGCVEYLCQFHHQDHRNGVHHNREFDLRLKMKHQSILEQQGMTREEFIKIFGKSWV